MPVHLTRNDASTLARGLKPLLTRFKIVATHQQCLGYIAEIAGWRNQETLAANYRLVENISAVKKPVQEPVATSLGDAINAVERQFDVIKNILAKQTSADLINKITRLADSRPAPADFGETCNLEDDETHGTAITNVEEQLADWLIANPNIINIFRSSTEWSDDERLGDAKRAAYFAEKQWARLQKA